MGGSYWCGESFYGVKIPKRGRCCGDSSQRPSAPMHLDGQQPGHLHNSRARGPRFRPWSPPSPIYSIDPCAPAAALLRLARVSAALRSTGPRTNTGAKEAQLLCKSGQFITKALAVFKVLTLLIQVSGQYHLGFRGSVAVALQIRDESLLLSE